MRKPILAGNWKMNKTPAEAVEFVRALRPLVTKYENVETVVCVPFVALPAVADALRGVKVGVGAQNMHWADSGAYTGEVSAPMLKGLAEYVIIGHSERREYFGETDETVNKKIKAALDARPDADRLRGRAAGSERTRGDRRVRQRPGAGGVRRHLGRATRIKVVVAYEPIWAIGTGKTATSADANRICGIVVRGTLAELYGEQVAQAIRIQYGGSANEKNIGELMSMPDIDGALIGGASLKLDGFSDMVRITSER